MKDNDTYYIDLITRYFSGEITEDELHLLSTWIKEDKQHELHFRQYAKTWQIIEEQRIHSSIHPDQEWIALQSKINKPVEGINGSGIITLKTEPIRQRFSVFNSWRAVAAAVTVLFVSSFLLYFYFSKPSNILVTAHTDTIELVLPDGSAVSLHAGSEITYPEKFTSGNRKISLKGEAYFNVAHDKTKPFIVASGDARVEVLGTQFNVNTNSSENTMEVVLTSGKVSVYYKAKPETKILLKPGEKAELLTNQRRITKTTNTDPNYMAWKTRILVFDNENLGKVLATLEHVYQTPVLLADNRITDCKVTAKFNDQSLESVLEVLKLTLDLQVKKDGKVITISGNACK
jgi:ferric-dicitrate binding protein FerR (iron transport regulator)